MPTKITFIFDNPADPAAFETTYKSIEDTAKQLPKLRRYEAGKVWPKENGAPTPAHRTLDLYFDSYDDASAAVAASAGTDLMGQLRASGTPFTGLFSDIDNG
ncbi:EthD family reductase [Arthrobacter sp. ATA002]|uniref:EthD family reductase n=1 Tax=Arthrobacter sp. ATA002 TaxID=2991715 RepID=UPI0022A6FC18|nr:EthD family reductase [Arthrobacter sp. ATA002]WAP50792.1 EthD family reductase [Arthrobacter sp. ATA002]